MQVKKILFLLLIMFSLHGLAQQNIKLNSGWMAKRANEVAADGTVISRPDYQLQGWMDAVVPGTVLTTLLHNQKIPDPFFGLNNEEIADISKTGNDYYTYWFADEFKTPELKPGEQAWLKFRGINYAADIFLNGKRVNTDTHQGMFLREKYLVTQLLESGTNRLAVIVYPPNPAGSPGGQGGDGLIAKSVAMQFTAGWDWICPIADRNTGIWDEVSLETSGAVDLLDPYVVTKVPGKRVPQGKQAPALIDLSADLANTTAAAQSGKLVARCENYEVSKSVEIPAGEKITVILPEIKMENPKLWWPNGMGDQPLYRVEFSFVQNKNVVVDAEQVTFGVRQTDSRFDETLKGRIFLVNGQDVFIKGGNWIASDALLRLSPRRYEAEVRMHAEMNMNMIRVWGGSMTERPEFYDACDKYGILVWQDLWISGDCNGRWEDKAKIDSQERRRAYPDSHSLFLASVTDQVKMLRNHPSLYLWCGGNEFPPPDDIDKKLRSEIFPKYDHSRFYLNESTSSDLATNTLGGTGDGPYGIQNPLRFFTVQSFPFNPELGSVGLPNLETLRRMMDEKNLIIPGEHEVDEVWQYHKYIGYGNFIDQYGAPENIADFVKKAQLVNYEQYRSLQEGFNAGMWNKYTGMLVWKNQNPWTALRGQFYDVFLDQNGGFYGYRHGAAPVHVQLNLNDSSVCVVNQTLADRNMLMTSEVFDIHGDLLASEQSNVLAAANKISIIKKLDFKSVGKPGYFLKLKLTDPANEVIDENFYWLAGPGNDYSYLNDLKQTSLQTAVEFSDSLKRMVVLNNVSNETAFFVRMKVVNMDQSRQALPVFFSENYVTLLPGESREITIDLSLLPEKEQEDSFSLELGGWNVPPQSLKMR